MRFDQRVSVWRMLLLGSLLLLLGVWLGPLWAASQGWGRVDLLAAGASLTAQPGDRLIVQFTAPLPPQQMRVFLTWQQGAQRHHLPFVVRVDAANHTLVAPVGAHPGWQGTVQQVRLVALTPATPITVTQIVRVPRPLFAPDMWLLRQLHPLLPALPSVAQVQLCISAVVGVGIALLLPWSHWRRRLLGFGLILTSGLASWMVITHLYVLGAVMTAYGGLTTSEAALRAPTYTAHPAAIAQIRMMETHLPNAPVLLLDVSPEGDLLHLARYLLYPRRVDVRSPQDNPPALPDLLHDHYGTAIQLMPTVHPPAPGWQRLTTPDGPLALWVDPARPAASPIARAAVPLAVFPLLAGLLSIGGMGWAVLRGMGWRGVFPWAAAWPLRDHNAAINILNRGKQLGWSSSSPRGGLGQEAVWL